MLCSGEEMMLLFKWVSAGTSGLHVGSALSAEGCVLAAAVCGQNGELQGFCLCFFLVANSSPLAASVSLNPAVICCLISSFYSSAVPYRTHLPLFC